MRILAAFCALTSVLVAQPQNADNYTCKADHEDVVNELVADELSDLREQILMLSHFEIKTTSDATHMRIVAQEAVFAFANDVSSHAEQLQRCALPMNEYYAQARQMNLFTISLNEATYDLFMKASTKFPLHPIVENVLIGFARRWQGPVDITDPVQVAARELLGEKATWKVSTFKPIRRLQLNPNNVLNRREFLFSADLEKFRNKPFSERLVILAEFYKPLL